MREYIPRYPLLRVGKNVYKDSDGKLLSENITYLLKWWKPDDVLKLMEKELKKFLPEAELCYEIVSGNLWIKILYEKNYNSKTVEKISMAYEKMRKIEWKNICTV